jgi:hypothetical protein
MRSLQLKTLFVFLFILSVSPLAWSQGGAADSGQAANSGSQNTGNNPGNAHAEGYGSGGNAPTGGSGNTVGSSGPPSNSTGTGSTGSTNSTGSVGSGTNSNSGANGSTNSDRNNDRGSCCTFGGNVGGTNTTATNVISSGTQLSFSPSIVQGSASPNLINNSSSELSMGTVVDQVQNNNTSSSNTTNGSNGGFDRNGNFYSLGTPVPPTTTPPRSLLASIVGVLETVPVAQAIKNTTQNLYQVSVRSVNAVGRVVQPHAQTLVSAVNKSVAAGLNIMKNAEAELARPEIREALGLNAETEEAKAWVKEQVLQTTKAMMMNSEQLAYFSEVDAKYDELGIPEDKRWLPGGPATQVTRFANTSPEDKELARIVDEQYRARKVDVIVPDYTAVVTPSFIDSQTLIGLKAPLTPTQHLGAMTSITVIGPAEELDRIVSQAGVNSSFGSCGCKGNHSAGTNDDFSGVPGGINLVRSTDENGNPEDYAGTLTHELTHAGDRAVLADLEETMESQTTSQIELEKLAARLDAAHAAWDGNINDIVDERLKGKITEEWSSDPIEFRAGTTMVNSTYVDIVANRHSISTEDAAKYADAVLNDPAIKEMNRLLDEHAIEMIERAQ